jgi:hypothetical protein
VTYRDWWHGGWKNHWRWEKAWADLGDCVAGSSISVRRSYTPLRLLARWAGPPCGVPGFDGMSGRRHHWRSILMGLAAQQGVIPQSSHQSHKPFFTVSNQRLSLALPFCRSCSERGQPVINLLTVLPSELGGLHDPPSVMLSALRGADIPGMGRIFAARAPTLGTKRYYQYKNGFLKFGHLHLICFLKH